MSTKAAKDLGRLLPSDKEDLAGVAADAYGLATMAGQTVAGVAIARRPAGGLNLDGNEAARRHAVTARNVAKNAARVARAANKVAADAKRVADRAGRFAQGAWHQFGPGAVGMPEGELKKASVDPHATAEELLEIRTTLLARSR